MREINYYLKKHMISTVIAMLLFVIQGLCIVALVLYGNNIVNFGLLRYGYESNTPEALLQTSFDKKLSTLNQADSEFVKANYSLLNRTTMTLEEYQTYESIYPVISSEMIYKKNSIVDQTSETKLNKIFFISSDDLLLEYSSLGMKPLENQQIYIKKRLNGMMIISLFFVVIFASSNFLVTSIASWIGYEERTKVIKGEGKGLRQSLDLQDRIKTFSQKFYALILFLCSIGLGIYYVLEYRDFFTLNQTHIVIWGISLLVFSVAIYSAISVRGSLNKGIFLFIKVAILAAITATWGKEISIGIILGYASMLFVLTVIRKIIGARLNTLVAAHADNIDNIDGQMSFVMNDANVTIEAVHMKKMVRDYLANNEYLYRSSWILELLENLDKSVITLFNFFGVIAVIASFSYMFIHFGLSLIMILPLFLVYNF